VDIAVETAGVEDVAQIIDLWRGAGAEPSVTDDEDGVQALLAHDPEALVVARSDGRVIGSVMAAWNGWRGSLYRLAVLPEHRRLGVGRRLVDEAERRLRSRGARRIDAVVTTEREDALRFWAAVGYDLQENRVRFVKNLS
jgi:ribosomal protein S18 acetylase RimI-like enzyme